MPQGPPHAEAHSPQVPPAERTGPTPGAGRGPQVPHAERTGPGPGMGQPPHAERTGPVPGMGQVPHAERTGPVPGMRPQPRGAHPERTGPVPTGRSPLPHHSTTGQGRLPGYPQAKPKKSLFTGCVTALVIAAVLLVLLLAVLAWLFRPQSAAGADGPAQDGKLIFTVSTTTCSKPAKAAAKRVCRIGVKVNNVGPDARVLYPGQQKLIDEDDELHGGTKLLDKGGTEITPIRIESGGTFTGVLVFELPESVDPVGLEVHDSGLSEGARINLAQ